MGAKRQTKKDEDGFKLGLWLGPTGGLGSVSPEAEVGGPDQMLPPMGGHEPGDDHHVEAAGMLVLGR